MIEEFKIGSFKVEGKKFLGDIKFYNGKARHWDDRHKQILEEKDIIDILATQPEIFVIGNGCNGLLEISEQLEKLIKQHNVPYLIQKTPEAVKTFNQLRKEQKHVAAIFHATG